MDHGRDFWIALVDPSEVLCLNGLFLFTRACRTIFVALWTVHVHTTDMSGPNHEGPTWAQVGQAAETRFFETDRWEYPDTPWDCRIDLHWGGFGGQCR